MIKTTSTRLSDHLKEYGVNLLKVEKCDDITITYNGKESEYLNIPYLKGYFKTLLKLQGGEIVHLEKYDRNDTSIEPEQIVKVLMLKDENVCYKFYQAVLLEIEKPAKRKQVTPTIKKVTPKKSIDDFDDDDDDEFEADELPVFTKKPASKPAVKKVAQNVKIDELSDIQKLSLVMSILSDDKIKSGLIDVIKKQIAVK